MSRPIITLTTDFGTRDSYVAQMKGVLLSQGPPELRLVDLTHEIAPQNTAEAALFLKAAAPRFPDGTVHVAVIDPGVGSARAALIVRTRRFFLVGPDNGVLSHLFDGSEEFYAIDPAKVARGPVSATFHGRDLFAPAAARLAAGDPPRSLGTPLKSAERLPLPLVEFEGSALHGKVIHVDRFGNLITNLSREVLGRFVEDASRVRVEVAGKAIEGLSEHYAQVQKEESLALVGSSEFLEVAVREGSAAALFGVGVGAHVTLVRNS